MTSFFRSSGLGTLGLLSVVPLLASCAAAEVAQLDATTEGVEASISDGEWQDGTYRAEGGYRSPEGAETVVVSLTVANNVITEISVTPNATNSTSKRYQGQFAEGIATETVGKPLGALQVSRVSGSSLTSGGFNQALEAIKADATR